MVEKVEEEYVNEYILEVNDPKLISYFMQNWWISSFDKIGIKELHIYLVNIPAIPEDAYDNIMATDGVISISKNIDLKINYSG